MALLWKMLEIHWLNLLKLNLCNICDWEMKVGHFPPKLMPGIHSEFSAIKSQKIFIAETASNWSYLKVFLKELRKKTM